MCLKFVKIATHSMTELTKLRVAMTYSYGYGCGCGYDCYSSVCCSIRSHCCCCCCCCYGCLDSSWPAMKMCFHHYQRSCDAAFQLHSPFPMHVTYSGSRLDIHLHCTQKKPKHKKINYRMNLFIRFVSIIPKWKIIFFREKTDGDRGWI